MDESRSPWATRGFVLGAALVAFVAVLAVLLVVTGHDRHPANSTARATRAPSRVSVSAAKPAAAGSECGLPAGSQSVPTSPPAAAGWVLVGSMAAPNSPASVGPGRTAGGFRQCFAHSPTGALFSAVNFWAAGTAFPPSQVYAHLAADTPSRAAAVRSRRVMARG